MKVTQIFKCRESILLHMETQDVICTEKGHLLNRGYDGNFVRSNPRILSCSLMNTFPS